MTIFSRENKEQIMDFINNEYAQYSLFMEDNEL